MANTHVASSQPGPDLPARPQLASGDLNASASSESAQSGTGTSGGDEAMQVDAPSVQSSVSISTASFQARRPRSPSPTGTSLALDGGQAASVAPPARVSALVADVPSKRTAASSQSNKPPSGQSKMEKQIATLEEGGKKALDWIRSKDLHWIANHKRLGASAPPPPDWYKEWMVPRNINSPPYAYGGFAAATHPLPARPASSAPAQRKRQRKAESLGPFKDAPTDVFFAIAEAGGLVDLLALTKVARRFRDIILGAQSASTWKRLLVKEKLLLLEEVSALGCPSIYLYVSLLFGNRCSICAVDTRKANWHVDLVERIRTCPKCFKQHYKSPLNTVDSKAAGDSLHPSAVALSAARPYYQHQGGHFTPVDDRNARGPNREPCTASAIYQPTLTAINKKLLSLQAAHDAAGATEGGAESELTIYVRERTKLLAERKAASDIIVDGLNARKPQIAEKNRNELKRNQAARRQGSEARLRPLGYTDEEFASNAFAKHKLHLASTPLPANQAELVKCLERGRAKKVKEKRNTLLKALQAPLLQWYTNVYRPTFSAQILETLPTSSQFLSLESVTHFRDVDKQVKFDTEGWEASIEDVKREIQSRRLEIRLALFDKISSANPNVAPIVPSYTDLPPLTRPPLPDTAPARPARRFVDPIDDAEEARISAELSKYSHRLRSKERTRSGMILHYYPAILGELGSFTVKATENFSLSGRLVRVAQKLLTLCGMEDGLETEDELEEQHRGWACAECKRKTERPKDSDAEFIDPPREGMSCRFEDMIEHLMEHHEPEDSTEVLFLPSIEKMKEHAQAYMARHNIPNPVEEDSEENSEEDSDDSEYEYAKQKASHMTSGSMVMFGGMSGRSFSFHR